VSIEAQRFGLRMPGTRVPGLVRAGSFTSHGRRVFWDVRRREAAVTIQLRDEDYDEIVVQVADADETARSIEAAIKI
jgi:hypothetical protein